MSDRFTKDPKSRWELSRSCERWETAGGACNRIAKHIVDEGGYYEHSRTFPSQLTVFGVPVFVLTGARIGVSRFALDVIRAGSTLERLNLRLKRLQLESAGLAMLRGVTK